MNEKDKQLYEIAKEQEQRVVNGFSYLPLEQEELKEILLMIRRSEYKRGKSDGIKEHIKKYKDLVDKAHQEPFEDKKDEGNLWVSGWNDALNHIEGYLFNEEKYV